MQYLCTSYLHSVYCYSFSFSLQSTTGLQDLGLLHHKPYQDSHGAIVFVLVQYVEVRTTHMTIQFSFSFEKKNFKVYSHEERILL